MPILNQWLRLLPLLFDVQAVKAMLTWPEFSITAYSMVTDLARQGVRPQTVIDVGANVGQFSIAALNIFKGVEVHAFEPIQSCTNKLRANTHKFDKVHIHPVALGARPGYADFHINTYSLASSLLRISDRHLTEFPQTAEKDTISAEVSTLDNFFFTLQLSPPVLLKIDVQGSEKDVLTGGYETLKKVDFVLMETSFTPMYDSEPLFSDLIDDLKSLNYQFLRPVNFLKSRKNGEILQADILFKRRTE